MNIRVELTEREIEVLMGMILEKKYHLHRMAASSNISISAISWQRYLEVDVLARKLHPPIEKKT